MREHLVLTRGLSWDETSAAMWMHQLHLRGWEKAMLRICDRSASVRIDARYSDPNAGRQHGGDELPHPPARRDAARASCSSGSSSSSMANAAGCRGAAGESVSDNSTTSCEAGFGSMNIPSAPCSMKKFTALSRSHRIADKHLCAVSPSAPAVTANARSSRRAAEGIVRMLRARQAVSSGVPVTDSNVLICSA